MKKCKQCEIELTASNCYKGHSKCKNCYIVSVKENRLNNIDYYLEYDRRRASLPKRVAARLKYSATENGKEALRRGKAKWSESNILKRAVHIIVGNAVRDGLLIKPENCSSCGKDDVRIHGHHCDYAKPMDVLWMCSSCHCAWHKVNVPING